MSAKITSRTRHLGRTSEYRPKVLIRTFAPNTNVNYGGILQAWALQQALDGLGYQAYVDDRSQAPVQRGKHKLKQSIAFFFPASRLGQRPLYAQHNRRLLEFPRRRIKSLSLRTRNPKKRERLVAEFSAFIVGSDQVWRPEYSDLLGNLFDFLPSSFAGPRVAYAASFGTESPRIDEGLRRASLPLAQRLTAVSVRETSGIELCRNLWDIDARRCIDPTMLLDRAVYENLAGSSADVSGGLVSYVLDESAQIRALLDQLIEATGVSEQSVRIAVGRQTGAQNSAPSVEEWLRRISEAEYLVTDSFHGCVFAILFNRPFLLIPNTKRGLARFETLLQEFGLEDRIADVHCDPVAQMAAPIDWQVINRRISEERAVGLAFLEQALAGVRLSS